MSKDGTGKTGRTDSIRKFSEGWYDKMVEIWRDRLDLLRIKDTGALRASVDKGGFSFGEAGGSMGFTFLEYGIFVDLGVGNGYRHGNGGDLPFLSPAYRYEHNLGKPRQKRPWFNKSWYISTLVLKDKLAEVIGEEFAGMFDNLTHRERG